MPCRLLTTDVLADGKIEKTRPPTLHTPHPFHENPSRSLKVPSKSSLALEHHNQPRPTKLPHQPRHENGSGNEKSQAILITSDNGHPPGRQPNIPRETKLARPPVLFAHLPNSIRSCSLPLLRILHRQPITSPTPDLSFFRTNVTTQEHCGPPGHVLQQTRTCTCGSERA